MHSGYTVDELLDLEYQREEEEKEFQILLRKIEAVAANVKGLQGEQQRLQHAATKVNDHEEDKTVDEEMAKVRQGVEELTVEYADLLADKDVKAELLECVKAEEKQLRRAIDVTKIVGFTEFRSQFKVLHDSLRFISELNPFMYVKAKVLSFEEWQKGQKDLLEQSKATLHSHHGCICKVMNEVKFFTHDPAGWKRFVISIEKKTSVAILKGIQRAVETFLDGVRGLKEPLFSIVLKINNDGKLSFLPSVSEVVNALQSFGVSLVQLAAEVERVPSRLNFNPDQDPDYKMNYSPWLSQQQPLSGLRKRLEVAITKLPDNVADFMCTLEDEYRVLWNGDAQKWNSASGFGLFQHKLQVHWEHNVTVEGISINTSNVQKTLLLGLRQSQTVWEQKQDAMLQSIKDDERDDSVSIRERMLWGRDENLQMLNSCGTEFVMPEYQLPSSQIATWQPIETPKVGSASRMARQMKGRERSNSISSESEPKEDVVEVHPAKLADREPEVHQRVTSSDPCSKPEDILVSSSQHSQHGPPLREAVIPSNQRAIVLPEREIERTTKINSTERGEDVEKNMTQNVKANMRKPSSLPKQEDDDGIEFSAEKVLEELQLTPSQRAAIFAKRSVAVDRSIMGTSLKKMEVPSARASTASPTAGRSTDRTPLHSLTSKSTNVDDSRISMTINERPAVNESSSVKTAFVETKQEKQETPTRIHQEYLGQRTAKPSTAQYDATSKTTLDLNKQSSDRPQDNAHNAVLLHDSALRTTQKPLDRSSNVSKVTTAAGWDTSGFSREMDDKSACTAAASESAAPLPEKPKSIPTPAAPSPTLASNPVTGMVQTMTSSLLAIYKQHCAVNKIKPNSGLLKILPNEVNVFISEINMDYNYIGIKGIQPLLEILKINHNLRILNLKDNNLENAEVKALCQVLLDTGDETLEVLDLSNNPVSLSGGSALIELATKIRTLREIRLTDTLLQPKIIEKIQEITQGNKDRARYN